MEEDLRKSAAGEALDNVKRAEEKARFILRQAREKTSVQMIKEAFQAAERIKEGLLAEAKKEAESGKKEIIEKAVLEAGRIRREAESQAFALKEKASLSMESAVRMACQKAKEFLEEGGF